MCDKEQFKKVCKGLRCHSDVFNEEPDCEHCEYDNANCGLEVPSDAFALIRQQQEGIAELEAGQMARVMTLEEIDSILTNSKEDHEKIFWVESKSRTRYSFGVFQLDYADDGDFEALLMGCSWPFHYRRETYGITWRVWTTKPTDEQRKAVPWNERSSI